MIAILWPPVYYAKGTQIETSIMSKKSLVKLLLSAGMLFLVWYSVDFERLKADLRSVPMLTIAGLIFGYMFSQAVSSFRWWIVTRASGIHAPFRTALSATFIGSYLNCFGLGTLGGDIARAILIAPDMKQRQTSFATVVADRGFGLAVLALIGIVASLLFYSQRFGMSFVWIGGSIIGVVTLGWITGPRVMNGLFRGTRWGEIVDRVMRGFPSQPLTIGLLFLVALFFHLLQISLFACMVSGLGISIPWGYLLVAIPFANVASTLPLSWMGLGVRENAYVLLFVPAYMSKEQAVLCGALWLIAMTVSSATGGIVAVLSGDLRMLKKKSETLAQVDGEPILEA